MSGRLKLKSIYPTFEEFSTFCMDTITEFYPRLVTDMPNSVALKSEIERYVFKPLYRQFKNATCRYLPTEEGIDAFNNQFSNQLEEVVFDFLVYTSTNLYYFNESYTKVGENLEQGVTTYNSPINQDITNTKSNTTIAKGATAQNINLMVYNGNTSWLKAFSSYYTPQRKAELIDKFRWLFISFYVGSDEGVTLVELSEALSMANGNMVITPEENEILRKVIIEKPEKLIPENIRDGVNIGGVEGSLVQGVIPSGILEITENGLYNVTDKEGVNVNVVTELPVDNGMIYEGKYRVRYFDIDGTILKIEYVANGGRTTPPDAPSYDSDYLIFDEWNYDINNYIVEQPTDIEAIYRTKTGDTYLFIKLTENIGLTIPPLNINGATSIDWGDGTVDSNLTHTYTDYREYVIKISGMTSITNYLFGSSTNVYSNCLQKCYLGNSVTSIGNYIFNYCRSLTSVTIPNSVTSIGNDVFSDCYSLTSITIPNSVTSIGDGTFYSCYPLTSITIPNSVTSIGNSAFYSCHSLTSITIPNSVTSIGKTAFYYCYSIINYIFNCNLVPTLSNANAFNTINKSAIIWVRDELVDAYKSASNWSNYASYIKPLSWYPRLTNQNE